MVRDPFAATFTLVAPTLSSYATASLLMMVAVPPNCTTMFARPNLPLIMRTVAFTATAGRSAVTTGAANVLWSGNQEKAIRAANELWAKNFDRVISLIKCT
jgi:hypothetical protein